MCESRVVAVKKPGTDSATMLHRRLSDLEAAQSVGELVAGNPHMLSGSRSGQFALNLAGGKRLVFSSANEPVPTGKDGGIDWQAVTMVRIEYIGDYHD